MTIRCFTFIWLVICSPINIFAQSLGIRPALNFATLDGEVNGINSDSDIHTGFDLGLFYLTRLSSGVEFSPEFHYIEKGGKNFGDAGTTEIRINYLEINPAFRFSFSENEKLQPFLLISPLLGYMISGEESGEDLNFENINRIDYGIVSGIGLLSNLGKSTIGIDLRYNYGLADYQKSSLVEASNRAFNLGIYLQINGH